MRRASMWGRVLLCAAVLVAGGGAVAPRPAAAFEWSGKVAHVARDLGNADPQVRLRAVTKLAEFAPEKVKKYLIPVLEDRDPAVRREAARVLARGKVAEVAAPLGEWLQSYDKNERIAAAELFGELGSPQAIAALGRALGDTEAEVRRAAVEALGKIGGPDVITPIVGRLDDDAMVVRRAAAERLRDLRDPRAVLPLVERFSDPAKEVRLAAVQGVGRLGDPRATPALVRMLKDPVQDVRLAAVEALGLLRSPEAVDALLPLLDGRSDEIGSKVCEALGRIGDERAVRVLVRHLGASPLRAAAAEALGVIGPRAVPAVVACLEGRGDECDPTVVVPLLGKLGDTRATPALTAELGRARVKKEAVVDALAAIEDPAALVPLLGLLESGDAALKKQVLRAIAPIADARAGAVLVGLLGDADVEVRLGAIELLGVLGVRAAVTPLLAMLGESTPMPVRVAAVRALGLIGDPRATKPLIERLELGPGELRGEASDALAVLADPASIAPLLALAADPKSSGRRAALAALRGPLRKHADKAVRDKARPIVDKLARGNDVALALDAIDVIGAMGDPASVPILIELGGAAARPVRRAALAALGQLRVEKGRELLVAALADADDGVRATAAWALGKLGGGEVVAQLGKAARDKGFATQVNAVGALARLGAGAAKALGDEPLTWSAHRNPWVRANAAVILGYRKDEAARRRLVDLVTQDSHRYVRAAAAQALGRMGGGDAVLRSVADKDDARPVREAAARALAPAAPAAARDEWVHVYWNDADGAPLRAELFVFVGSDGIAMAGYTDLRGQAGEEGFPRGPWDYQCLGTPGPDAFTALDLCTPAAVQ